MAMYTRGPPRSFPRSLLRTPTHDLGDYLRNAPVVPPTSPRGLRLLLRRREPRKDHPALATLPNPHPPTYRHAPRHQDRLPPPPPRPPHEVAIRDHRLGATTPVRRRTAPWPLPQMDPRARADRAQRGD